MSWNIRLDMDLLGEESFGLHPATLSTRCSVCRRLQMLLLTSSAVSYAPRVTVSIFIDQEITKLVVCIQNRDLTAFVPCTLPQRHESAIKCDPNTLLGDQGYFLNFFPFPLD